MRLTGGDWASGRRRACLSGGLCLLLGAATGAMPAHGQPAVTQVTVFALGGYDPVSYFLAGGPRLGSPRFEMVWAGRAWRFAAEANRAAFQRDPEVYAPRLGGFDAAGILDRRLVEADPALFMVIDERLYLFRNEERRARFLAEPGLAVSAEAIWPELRTLLDDPPPRPPSPAAKPPEAPVEAKPIRGTLGDAGRRTPPAE